MKVMCRTPSGFFDWQLDMVGRLRPRDGAPSPSLLHRQPVREPLPPPLPWLHARRHPCPAMYNPSDFFMQVLRDTQTIESLADAFQKRVSLKGDSNQG